MRLVLVSSIVVAATVACEPPRPSVRSAPAARSNPTPPTPSITGVRIVPAAASGEVATAVRTAAADARRENRVLLVYVGASWCEPCGYFHHAVERGALDRDFPRLTLLEFDLDRDAARLREAGYVSRMIPLIAIPDPDGRATDRRLEGSIHGEAAVGEITGRLRALLAGSN